MVDQASSRFMFFSDALPREGGGVLIHYEYEPVAVEGWTTCDIREIVRLNEDAWLSEIDTWHRELSEQATELTRWWWLLPGSRLILWRTITSFSLKPILFALAVINLCNRQSTGIIWIVGAPDELVEYLSEWSSNEKLRRIKDTRARTRMNYSNSRIFATVKFWLKLARQIALLLRHVTFRERKCAGPASVIVNSLVLNPDLIQSNGDHFFGHILDHIEGLSNSDIIWLYSDTGINYREARSKLADIGRNFYFISDFFRWPDLWFALRVGYITNQALRKLLNAPSPLRAGGVVVTEFSHSFLANLAVGNIPLFELILYKQLSRVLRESGTKVLIYAYEEKPMERAMLLAVRDFAPEIKTIGFAHGAYSKGHLYMRRASYGEPPRPNFVTVTGRIARDNFEKAGVPPGQIVFIGSPRHHDLVKDTPSSCSKTRRQLLILIGHGFELRILATLIESKPDLFSKYDLVIRRAPYSWIKEQDAAELRMQAEGIIYRCEGGDLITQIDESDIVIFESTAAGMEAALRGKMVIQFNLSDIVSTNHFYGSGDHDEIKYCHNADELEILLKDIATLTPSQYTIKTKRQRELAEGLYSPVDQAAIGNLLIKKTSH